MKSILLITALVALSIGFPAVHAGDEGGAGTEHPAVGAASLIMLSATVTAVNQETREVTLKGADGKELAITVGEEVKNLPQVAVGDQVEVAYTSRSTLRSSVQNRPNLGRQPCLPWRQQNPARSPPGQWQPSCR